MSLRTRRQFTGQQKVEIVKRHLVDGVGNSSDSELMTCFVNGVNVWL